MQPSRRPRLMVLALGAGLALGAASALAGCSVAVPGNPVLTPRVLAAAAQVRDCADAVARTTASADALLDAMDRAPSGSPVDAGAIGRFFEGMRRDLNGSCGYWSQQSGPQSAVVLHLAEQPPGRSAAARTAASAMVASICGSVEGPLDQHGVSLTPQARAVCVAT